MKPFDLSIITPERTAYEGRVSSLVVPAALGYLGVLADHAPLAANLIKGKIILRKESGEALIFESEGKGFLEVLHNRVNIILTQGLSQSKT